MDFFASGLPVVTDEAPRTDTGKSNSSGRGQYLPLGLAFVASRRASTSPSEKRARGFKVITSRINTRENLQNVYVLAEAVLRCLKELLTRECRAWFSSAVGWAVSLRRSCAELCVSAVWTVFCYTLCVWNIFASIEAVFRKLSVPADPFCVGTYKGFYFPP